MEKNAADFAALGVAVFAEGAAVSLLLNNDLWQQE